MKFALLIVACMAGQPTDCIEHTRVLPEVTNATACHLAGQMELRSWLRANRDQRLSDARCVSMQDAKGMTTAAVSETNANSVR